MTSKYYKGLPLVVADEKIICESTEDQRPCGSILCSRKDCHGPNVTYGDLRIQSLYLYAPV